MMKFFDYLVTVFSYIKNPKKRKLIRISYQLKNKTGLEVGGPSAFFGLKSYFPVYVFAKEIDGVNFSTETIWEGKIKEGKNYNYRQKKNGYQYICEASELNNVKQDSYDFILSCHSLEHVANPIKAIKNWNKALKEKAKIILVLPDKNFTFDHKRPYTTFDHLMKDYNNDTSEYDTSHFNEIFQLHDISKDSNIKNADELRIRAKDNYSNRCIHHHVFNMELLVKLLSYCGFKVLYKQKVSPFHLVIIGEKISY